MKIWVAVLIGFLLGVLSQLMPNLQAQIGLRQIGIHVRKFEANASDGMVPGSQVVGFSCPDTTRCYIATRD
jgi:hypothetical protein